MMSGMDWDGLTPNERLVAEQAVMNFRALNAACDASADGMGLKQGREATQRTLEMSLQMQDADVEKKNAPSLTYDCGILVRFVLLSSRLRILVSMPSQVCRKFGL
jgi:hypothetical protein